MSGRSSCLGTPDSRSTSNTLRGGRPWRIQKDGDERCSPSAEASLVGPPAAEIARCKAARSGGIGFMPWRVEEFSTPGKSYRGGSLNCQRGRFALPSAPMSKTLHKQQVGQNLRIVREALGMSQAQMATRFGMTDKSKLSHYERGVHYPDPYFVWLLWTEEGITADWIYLGQKRGLPSWVADGLRPAAEASPEASMEARRQAEAASEKP